MHGEPDHHGRSCFAYIQFFDIQSINREPIMMGRIAGRRTRSALSRRTKTVLASSWRYVVSLVAPH
jgi:hypothetical protein